MNTRFTLGAALVAAGVFAVPSFASASTSCTYVMAKRQVEPAARSIRVNP